MTFAELITKVNNFGRQFTSCQIPLYDEAYVEIQDIQFSIEEDEADGYFIQMTVK